MKSAMANSTSPTNTPNSENGTRKRARFDDDVITAEFDIQNTPVESKVVRRCSTPDRADHMRRILQRDSYSDHANSFHTDDSERQEDNELTTAISMFEEVVEELMQVAEEHAEAHEELANVAHKVAGVIFSRRQKSEERCDDEANPEINKSTTVCPRWISAPSGMIRQCSADADVDDSCMEDPVLNSSYSDDGSSEEAYEPESSAPTSSPTHAAVPTDENIMRGRSLEGIAEHANSSTETFPGQSSTASDAPPKRRDSEPQSTALNLADRDIVRRRVSMTDLTKSRLLSPSPKASPASCAVTVCSVRSAESPRLNTVYEHPGARYQMLEEERKPKKMAQTVRSDAGTFQALWIEPPLSSGSSDVTLLNSSVQAPELIISEEDMDIIRTPSPMDRVKTKLAAWSWAKEQGLDEFGGPNWIPLLPCHEDTSRSPSGAHSPKADEPYGPPNTERPSGASSAKHSAPHSPGPEEYDTPGADDDDEDHPLELKVKASLARPAPKLPSSLQKTQGDYLSLPIQQLHHTRTSPEPSKPSKPISRELSNIAIEETNFKSHKNSLVLLHERKDEGKMNQQLMNSRDSVILARSKFDSRHPKPGLDSKSAWTRHGALSPILDTSLPDTHVQASLSAMEKFMQVPEQRERQAQAQAQVADEAHPDEHTDCPICKEERPRWFEANCKKGHFM